MVTGWAPRRRQWYYLDGEGAMMTGWSLKVGDTGTT